MILIKHNKECYQITQFSRYGTAELACVDYTGSIEDHVQSIIEVLETCNAEYTLEVL